MSDDGFINVRVVMELHAGNGPVFNPGERVELTTSTLWFYLLALVSWIVPAEISVTAVVLGWICAVAAFVFAALGAVRFARASGQADGFPLPAGLLVVAAIPVMWDFATSGLEPAITFAWLAICFWGLARRLPVPGVEGPKPEPRAAWDPLWLPIVIGLGYLVRPDAALYSVGFAVALLWQSRRSWKGWVAAALLAVALPLAYQIFRMGYYGILVPNTALAKGAGNALWGLGGNYAWLFLNGFALWLPLLIGGLLLAYRLRHLIGQRNRAAIALVAGTVVPALAHVVYVIRVGGDFMHGRFLLPPLFALMLPIGVLFVNWAPARRWLAVSVAMLVLWAIYPVALYRPVIALGHGVTDERLHYTTYVPSHETVHIADWQGHIFAVRGAEARRDLEAGRRYYRTEHNVFFPAADGIRVAHAFPSIGVYSVVAGTDVIIVDTLGLADPIAARIPMPTQPEKIGHVERPEHWRVARYAAPSAKDTDDDRAAREIMQCAPLRELTAAISAPMTPARFGANLAASVRLTTLSIAPDVATARAELC
ncbi:hypothetical protein [Granulicoccus phenolivorans]|uniref:hypothetical protein n=1 Tax=Granulicoccus phenolivorans TaxID=266854 RepID=UPI000426A3BA|nr:hypothetical protein [Granulicoccus phenolivorans]